MSLLNDLGLRRVINAAAAQTTLGGALMPEPVLAAMQDAARYSVDLPEFHDRVGERIADLTGNEAACVCCGSAAGLLLAAAGCMTGLNQERAWALPDSSGLTRNEIVVWRAQQTGFLSAVRQTGALLVEIGQSEADLEAAIGPKTAAVLWFAGTIFSEETIQLARIIEISHDRGVPVIVDAADQIPPFRALSAYTREAGADLAIFSGGKGLLGPQASGVIVGRADLIAACRLNSGPRHSIGRPAKVGKEEMAGVLAAIEMAANKDEPGEYEDWLSSVENWKTALKGIDGITLDIVDWSHSGQPVPRLIITLETSRYPVEDLVASLWELDPRVAVLPEGSDAIALNPQLVNAEDRVGVSTAIRRTLLRED